MTPSFAARLALFSLLSSAALQVQAATVVVTVFGQDGVATPNAVVQVFSRTAVPNSGRSLVVISQKNVRFVPFMTAIPVGATVRFVNEDPFDHHLRSEPGGPLGTIPPAKEFEMRLAAAGEGKRSENELRFDKPGSILLGCHIHPSMRGHLFVSETPFVGVTNQFGQATLENVPDGQVELRAWNPEQLAEQPLVVKMVASEHADFDLTLNFTPPKQRRRSE